MMLQFAKMTSSSKNFFSYLLSLATFSYWSRYHVYIMTGSAVKKIFFYKGFTRISDIGSNDVWAFPNIWRLGQVRDAIFGMNSSNKMLVNAAKCQGYSFLPFLSY